MNSTLLPHAHHMEADASSQSPSSPAPIDPPITTADANAAVAADENDLHHVHNSLCPSCYGSNAYTKILPTNIPYFRQIIIVSVECPDCHFRDTQVDFGSVQSKGEKITLLVVQKNTNNWMEDIMNRQIVKSDSATVFIPVLDLELPAKTQTGVNTIEGMLIKAANNLESMQKERLRMGDVENFHRCRGVIFKLRRIMGRRDNDDDNDSTTSESENGNIDEELAPFTIILDDPAGNSFIENPYAPHPDPNMTCNKYDRTPTHDMSLGLQPSTEAMEAGMIDDTVTSHKNVSNGSSSQHRHCFEIEENRVQNLSQTCSDRSKVGPLHEEVMKFPIDCPHCRASAETNMCVTDIPHFKEVVIMCLLCEQCGYKSNEIKGGGAIPRFGTKITLHVKHMQDLAREVLKSDTAGVSVPDLDLELEEGGLDGMYTTVEGLMLKMHDRLRDVNPFGMGDSYLKQHADNDGETYSAPRQEHVKYIEFLARLKDMATGQRFPFTLILSDPLSNSFVGPKPEVAGSPPLKEEKEGTMSCYKKN
mmetsp:Transcript_17079/g.36838  ORF Transcript_17079/g.36838 Transcript_17079/m.36838 type:complete len:533 (+) Transcript_17079:1-1599(+)